MTDLSGLRACAIMRKLSRSGLDAQRAPRWRSRLLALALANGFGRLHGFVAERLGPGTASYFALSLGLARAEAQARAEMAERSRRVREDLRLTPSITMHDELAPVTPALFDRIKERSK